MKSHNIFTLLSIFGLAACSKVPPGNLGVQVNMSGDNKGVSTEVLTPGYHFLWPTQSLYIFPTFTQNYTWTKNANEGSPNDESFVFRTLDGMELGADIGIAYHVEADKVTSVFQKYRYGIDEITNISLHNMVRNALVIEGGKINIETAYGVGNAKLLKNVMDDVNAQSAPIGIIVEQLNWAGRMRLPEAVETSINNKIQATQRAEQAQNEVAVATAEANKAVATATGEANSTLVKAEAQAKANKIIAESLTPELVAYKTIDKWDGILPQVSGGVTPFINVTPKQNSATSAN